MEPTQAVWLIILTLVNALMMAMKIIEKKNGKKNGGNGTGKYKYNPHPPGETKICRENRDMIIAVTTKVEGIEDNIVSIFKKLDK